MTFETNLPTLTHDELIAQLVAQVEDKTTLWAAIPDFPEDTPSGSPDRAEWRRGLTRWAERHRNQELVAAELSKRLNAKATYTNRRNVTRRKGRDPKKMSTYMRRIVAPGGRRALDR